MLMEACIFIEVLLLIVIFDVDGTLIDSWAEILVVFRKVFKSYGFSLSEKQLRMTVGLPLENIIKELTGEENDEMVEAIRREFFSLPRRLIRLYPGVENVLKLPFKKAILTSKGRIGTIRDLAYFGLEHAFDMVVDADAVRHKKPNPEGIFMIINRFKDCADEVFMVGDTELDVLAAKSAGVKSIAVTWGFRDEQHLKQFNPDFIVDNYDELIKILKSYASL